MAATQLLWGRKSRVRIGFCAAARGPRVQQVSCGPGKLAAHPGGTVQPGCVSGQPGCCGHTWAGGRARGAPCTEPAPLQSDGGRAQSIWDHAGWDGGATHGRGVSVEHAHVPRNQRAQRAGCTQPGCWACGGMGARSLLSPTGDVQRWAPAGSPPGLSSRCHLPIPRVPVQELRTSLEKQRAQNSRLSVALEDERTAKDNLRKELQIEASRCEALLAQERGRLSELRRGLQAEQGHARELAEALRHERLLTEQLSCRTQACAHPEAPASPALLQQLQDEKARGAELQAALEEAQQRAARARELEAEARARCEELRREKEVSATPRSPVPAPPSCAQGREGDSPAWLQAEVEQSQSRLAAQGGRKDSRRRAGTRQSRADADQCPRWRRDKEKLVRAAAAGAARRPWSRAGSA